MLRKLRDKALAAVLRVSPKKRKNYTHAPLPDDPKELAKASVLAGRPENQGTKTGTSLIAFRQPMVY